MVFVHKVDVEFDFEVLDAVLDGFEGEVHVLGDRLIGHGLLAHEL